MTLTPEEWRDLLSAPDVRLDLGSVLSLSRGSLPSAQAYRHGYTPTGREKWSAEPVLLLAPEDDLTRAGLLRMIADIIELQDAEA